MQANMKMKNKPFHSFYSIFSQWINIPEAHVILVWCYLGMFVYLKNYLIVLKEVNKTIILQIQLQKNNNREVF